MGKVTLRCGSCFLLLFEGFEETIDHPLGTRIALSRDFLPEVGSVVFTFLPAFEDVWRVGIKIALPFASGSRIRSHTSLEPMPHRSVVHAKLLSNLLRSSPLLLQPFDVLIANFPLGSVRRDGLADLLSWGWSPFLNRSLTLRFRSVFELGK